MQNANAEKPIACEAVIVNETVATSNETMANNEVVAINAAAASNETLANNEVVAINEAVASNEALPLVEDNQAADVDNDDSFEFSDEWRDPFKISNCQSFITLMQCNVGAGLLIMPIVVSNGGLALGTAGVLVLAVLCIHCMHLLIWCNDRMFYTSSFTSYSETAKKVFQTGPVKMRCLAPMAKIAVSSMMFLAEFGFCCEAFLFMSGSLHEIAANIHGSASLSARDWMAIILPFVILFGFINNWSWMAVFSKISNLLCLVAIIITYSYTLPGPYSKTVVPYVTPLHKLPLYFGSVMYIFEGIGLILPIRSSMRLPKEMVGTSGVLSTSMIIVYSLYAGLGCFGYLKHGNNVQSSLSFNLPKTSSGESARIFFTFSIFMGYFFQMFVLTNIIIWPMLQHKFQLQDRFSDMAQKSLKNILRAVLVLLTFGIAMATPDIDLLICLIGSLGVTSLVLIFPPIMEIVTLWNTNIGKWKFVLLSIKDILLILFGLIICLTGTFTAIKEIVNAFRE